MANQIVIAPELGPEFEIGTTVAGKITVNVDGTTVVRNAGTGELSAPSGSLTYDNATTVLTYTNGAGGIQNINLASLTNDIFVNGGTFDAATSVLTLTDSDGTTPDVTIDLSSLLGVSTDANNILGNGTDLKPFLQASDITALATETCTSVFGVDLFDAFPA